MPKFSFYDFYFNNIYFKKCKRRERQDILDICNRIVSNYISIDSILNNMITFENLIKDYTWKDPRLNNLGNNELIKQLIKHL